QQLLAQIGRGVDQHPRDPRRLLALDQQRGAAATVFRVVWIAGAPAERRPRDTHRGATSQNCEFQRHAASAAAGRGTLENSRKKFPVVPAAASSGLMPRAAASMRAVPPT